MKADNESSAWKFIHPDFDSAGPHAGLQTHKSGGISLVSGAAAIRQSLFLLLSTNPGERVMRPGYGCPLHRILFGPNDDTTAGIAMHYVREAVERWEPRISITKLDAGRGSQAAGQAPPDDSVRGNRLYIHLQYRIKATKEMDQIVFDLDLNGDAG